MNGSARARDHRLSGVRDSDESTASLAVKAARAALDRAISGPADVDLITWQRVTPTTQHALDSFAVQDALAQATVEPAT